MRGDGAGLGAALHHQRWLNPFWYGRWVPLARGLGSPCPRPPLEKEDGADNPSVAFPALFFLFCFAFRCSASSPGEAQQS